MVPFLSACVSTGSVQHLRDDWWTSPGPLLSRDVLSMCKLNCKSSLKWSPEVLRGETSSSDVSSGCSGRAGCWAGHGLLDWHR